MSWYDWLLFLHVAGAFVLGMSLVTYWGAVAIAARPQGGNPAALAETISRPANFFVGAGAFVALVFGVWLAIYRDEYQVWDGWILTSIILWLVAVTAGGLAGSSYTKAAQREGPEADALRRRGLIAHTTASIGFLVILVLMIFKPGT
jgi:hypothetical protein